MSQSCNIRVFGTARMSKTKSAETEINFKYDGDSELTIRQLLEIQDFINSFNGTSNQATV